MKAWFLKYFLTWQFWIKYSKEETPEGKNRFYTSIYGSVRFSGGSDGQEPACSAGDPGSIPGWGRSPGPRQGNPLHSILAWRIPRTEEPCGLQSMGPQRIRHDWATNTFTFILITIVCAYWLHKRYEKSKGKFMGANLKMEKILCINAFCKLGGHL